MWESYTTETIYIPLTQANGTAWVNTNHIVTMEPSHDGGCWITLDVGENGKQIHVNETTDQVADKMRRDRK